MLRIVPYAHPALRYESRPVTRIDGDLRAAVRGMFDLMYEARGIGLAANQVALPFRFFVLNLSADRDQPDEERVFINPEIVKRHSSRVDEEGCLSFPGLYGDVRRAKRVRVKAFGLDGEPIEVDADELLGRALQHESDHLLGKLFIDHFEPAEVASTLVRVREIEATFHRDQADGLYPPDAEIIRQLDAMDGPSA